MSTQMIQDHIVWTLHKKLEENVLSYFNEEIQCGYGSGGDLEGNQKAKPHEPSELKSKFDNVSQSALPVFLPSETNQPPLQSYHTSHLTFRRSNSMFWVSSKGQKVQIF